MNRWVKVSILKDMQNPFEQITWSGLNKPISKSEVGIALREGRLHRTWEKFGPDWRVIHTERVAYFVKNGWRSAVYASIIPATQGGHTQQPVFDGLHRLAAAIYKGQHWILVHIDGDLELAEEVLKPYVHSDNGADVVGEIRGADKGSQLLA